MKRNTSTTLRSSSITFTALFILAAAGAAPVLAQHQLQCAAGDECSITCYQPGLDRAPEIFHREGLDTLQIDVSARVVKIETRDDPDQMNELDKRSYDYFILSPDASCEIENMRGMRDFP